MYIPSATYRVQLHQGFTLQQLQEILDYLHELGISTIYASPITTAATGSTHGYDVSDPHTLNPEIGSPHQLQQIAASLQQRGMGWIQDIVPNHMTYNAENKRLMDALERDSYSEFHEYFDIQWKHPSFHGKVMVPFLAEELQEAIDKGLFSILLTANGLYVQYGQQQYPLSLTAYSLLLSVFGVLAKDAGVPRDLYLLLDGGMQATKWAQWQSHKRELFTRLTANARHRQRVENWLTVINQDKALITQLLDAQYYTLCHWQQVNKEINYRRFFTVSSLICTRIQATPVFNDYHQWLHELYRESIIQGLRIDHIDGLYDPKAYLDQLRQLFGNDCYIIAEKILERGEELPADWPIQGESGYEFLAAVNQLLTNRQGGHQLARLYRSLLLNAPVYTREVVHNKVQVLRRYMQGEWDNLTRYFQELDLAPYEGQWKESLGILMAAMPVYRIYPAGFPLSEKERAVLEEAFAVAGQAMPACTKELNYLQALFCDHKDDPGEGQAILLFLKRFMQFTGPVMAKGVEDTTFYTYNALLSHNEVGDTPLVAGDTIGEFHLKMKARQINAPLALNATATHDTKRGEDARMRLNVLSEIPGLWEEEVKNWFGINEGLHNVVDGAPAPSRNDEYFIYQAIIGGFPEDGLVTNEWLERLQAYLQKALREAQVKTNWQEPHQAYEQACRDFIHRLFQQDHSFPDRLGSLMEQINGPATLKSLAHLLLKFTAPGIPDIYQGCELWDLSFVDPDNRRPVDYARRKQYLQQIKEQEAHGAEILSTFLRSHRSQGMEKLFLSYKALHLRKALPDLFIKGAYLPLHISGPANATIAYARHWEQQWVLTVIPLQMNAPGSTSDAWIELPAGAPANWSNVLTGEELTAVDNSLPLSVMGKWFPVGLWQPVAH